VAKQTIFPPHVDCGDYVIVLNAGKVKFTGKKWTDKIYTRHTGYPADSGFQRPNRCRQKPEWMIEEAPHMLPKQDWQANV
jgi:large subunit ribosomal protein L13